jgi:hypothetical protein
MQTSALLRAFLLVSFHDHLPLGKVANHHGAFNQSVSDEMRGFVQTVTLFVAFALRDALIDLTQMEVPARLLLAEIALRANLVELPVVPLMAPEATNVVDAPLLVHARRQGLDAQVKGHYSTTSWSSFRLFGDKGSVVVTARIP